jgi:hypothetical protein
MEAIFLIGFLWLGYRELKRYGSKFYDFQLAKHNATKALVKSSEATVDSHAELIATQKAYIDALNRHNQNSTFSEAPIKAANNEPGKVYTHLKNSKSIKRVNPTQAHH